MHLSSKGEYGIRAMLELTQRQGQGFVQSSEIALLLLASAILSAAMLGGLMWCVSRFDLLL